MAELLQTHVEGQIGNGVSPDPFRGLRLDESDVARLLARPSTLHDGLVEPPMLPFTLPSSVAESPLGRLSQQLQLDPFEIAVLALCLLPELDGRYGPLIGFLHDDVRRKQPSVELTLTLLAPHSPQGLGYLHYFRSDAPLLLWSLVELLPESALVRRPLALDPALLWYLLGHESSDPTLAGLVQLLPPTVPDIALPHLLLDALCRPAPHPLLLCSEDAGSCRAAATTAAALTGQQLLLIDGAALAADDAAATLLARALRDALLHGWLPCLDAATALLQGKAALATATRRLLQRYPGHLLLLAGESAAAFAHEEMTVVTIAPAPTATRLQQWHAATTVHGMNAGEPMLRALAETTGLAGPAIDEVVAAATTIARADEQAPDEQHLRRAVRATLRRRASTLDLTAPRFTWDDLVLPPDRLMLLHYLCDRVRYRSQVREEWRAGRGGMPGVTGLFAGEPGTGKSMAAEVVAHDLGLDLCRIDLAQTVSKYIGETEKNLARVFDEAERCGVVLVFDEADALFGKRSAVKDSHDRYANIETSYLLQRMERYRGLALLTTNLRANMDAAFTRRITVSVDFPAPDRQHRAEIWRRVLHDTQTPGAAEIDLDALATRLELTGGAITNIAVTAAHLAASGSGTLTQAHLQQALDWELRKMGRLPDATAGAGSRPLFGRNGHGAR